jgi:hypothetical protein
MAIRQSGSNSFAELADLARSGAAGLQDVMLRAQCDLFVQQGAEGAARLAFVALVQTLAPRVSHAALLDAARRLSPLPGAPAEVLEALFAEGGSVATTVIELAPVLPASLRAGAAAAEDPRLAAMFAGRHDLRDGEQEQLAMRGETAVNRALGARPGALGRAAAAALLDAARGDDQLAGVLLDRKEIDAAAKLPLYRFASPQQRRLIRAALDRRVAERSLPSPGRAATAAEQAQMMQAALDGVEALTSRAVAAAGHGPAFVMTILQDDSREILTLLLLALDVPAEDAVRMLLRTGDAVARDSRALGALVEILRHGERLTAHAVLAANWPLAAPAAPPARKAAHQPAMAEGGTPSRAPATTAAGQRRHPSTTVIERLRGPRSG